MGEFYINGTSQWMSSEYNGTNDYYDYYYTDGTGFDKLEEAFEIVTWIIFCISLPLILVSFYVIFSQSFIGCFTWSSFTWTNVMVISLNLVLGAVAMGFNNVIHSCSPANNRQILPWGVAGTRVRKDHIVPVYIISLLISDLIHICAQTIFQHSNGYMVRPVSFFISVYFEISSTIFTLCVAMERYLVIAHPLWYRFSQPIKVSIWISVLVMLFSLILLSPLIFGIYLDSDINLILYSIILRFLPPPFFIFFLVGTVRGLSAAIHISSTEKQRIVGTVVAPVVTYSLIFLPYYLWTLVKKIQGNNGLQLRSDLSSKLVLLLFFYFSPSINTILYVFIRKGVLDKLLAYLCCSKVNNSQISTTSVEMTQDVDIEIHVEVNQGEKGEEQM